jgi:DNA-binding PucR family transcriptional regulator
VSPPETASLELVGAAVLAAVDDVVAAVCEGYEDARRTASMAEEAVRREFVDDLLTGGARGTQVLERAPAFGLRLEAAHTVLVVSGSRRFLDHRVMVRDVEAALRARTGADAPVSLLVATRSGLLVAVVAADLADPARTVAQQLRREPALTWRLATSRARTGATGVRLGFDEARSAVELAERLGLPEPVVAAEDLLVHELLARDPERTAELVRSALLPLQDARGGADPLLSTLRAYFACGSVAVAAAARLHLSVRAVTYRLDRVRALTGRDPGDPDDRFLLEVALRGAQVLDWPSVPLPPVGER